MEYTQKLAEGGKFTLCIWPEHCLVSDDLAMLLFRFCIEVALLPK